MTPALNLEPADGQPLNGERLIRSTFTPAQHAQIRLQLALLPVYVWLVYGWKTLFEQLPQAQPVRDFAYFYLLGVAAREHNATALYDMDALAAVGRNLVPGIDTVRYPSGYPPQVAVLFRAFAGLPYLHALFLWTVATILIYAACVYAIWRMCPRLRDWRWTTMVLALAAPALHFTLGFAQTSVIALAAFTAAFCALRGRRRFLAGLCLGVLAYKPPLGIAAAFVLLFAGEWTILAGAAVSAAVQTAIGVAYWGPATFGGYLSALMRFAGAAAQLESNAFQMHSWRSFLELAGLHGRSSLALYAVLSIATLIVALKCWRSNGPLALRYAVLLIATVLVDPHVYAYELLVLTPALLLLWDVGRDLEPLSSTHFEQLLYFCYFAPLMSPLAKAVGLQLSVIGFALLGAWTARALLVRHAEQL